MNRYDFHLVHGAGHMRPRKHGEWVRYEDAQAEIDRLRKKINDEMIPAPLANQRIAELEDQLNRPVLKTEWQQAQDRIAELEAEIERLQAIIDAL